MSLEPESQFRPVPAKVLKEEMDYHYDEERRELVYHSPFLGLSFALHSAAETDDLVFNSFSVFNNAGEEVVVIPKGQVMIDFSHAESETYRIEDHVRINHISCLENIIDLMQAYHHQPEEDAYESRLILNAVMHIASGRLDKYIQPSEEETFPHLGVPYQIYYLPFTHHHLEEIFDVEREVLAQTNAVFEEILKISDLEQPQKEAVLKDVYAYTQAQVESYDEAMKSYLGMTAREAVRQRVFVKHSLLGKLMTYLSRLLNFQ